MTLLQVIHEMELKVEPVGNPVSQPRVSPSTPPKPEDAPRAGLVACSGMPVLQKRINQGEGKEHAGVGAPPNPASAPC